MKLIKLEIVSYYHHNKTKYADIWMLPEDYESFKENWGDIINDYHMGIYTIEKTE